jgi:hypothetical protein
MTTLAQLAQGTQSALPTAWLRYKDGMNKVETVKHMSFRGTHMEVFISTVRASGRDTGGTATKAYVCQLAFFEGNTPHKGFFGRVGCRCSCPAYYFWFSEANRRAGASYGSRFTPYKRKTPLNSGYPPKNPSMIPGMCKHLLLMTSDLQNAGVFRAAA